MEFYSPRELRDLFAVFDALNRSKPAALCLSGLADRFFARDFRPPKRASLGVFSSGTTNRPKLIWHSWSSLTRGIAPSEYRRWGSCFLPRSYAGVQVALHAWHSGGEVFSLSGNPDHCLRAIAARGVEVLCCTPTFLDLFLQALVHTRRLPALPLRQITLGGEVVRLPLIRQAQEFFPGIKFTSVYASAELGLLMKSRRVDGWYEIDSLEKNFPQWRVHCGELLVFREHRWVRTGDSVEVRGARKSEDGSRRTEEGSQSPEVRSRRNEDKGQIRVTGRCDAVANVGGNKVELQPIAALAESIPGIRRALAVAEPSAVLGQIVCLRFAVEAGRSTWKVQRHLEEILRAQLPKPAWPRRWVLDSAIPMANGKRT